MTVYLVRYDCYDEKGTIAVFSTEDAAEHFIARQTDYTPPLCIDAMEVDEKKDWITVDELKGIIEGE